MLSKKIRVLLADDHKILRQGVRLLIDSQTDMEVVGEAKTGREAIEEARRLKPDVVVMDVSMPELNGIEGTRQICDEMKHTRVLALSMHKDAVYVREVLRAGARGYLLKDSEDDDLVRAIRCLQRGEAFLSPAISDAVLNDYRKHVSNPVDLLTSREREILTMVADGKTLKFSALAISLFVFPSATIVRISRSRLVSRSTGLETCFR